MTRPAGCLILMTAIVSAAGCGTHAARVLPTPAPARDTTHLVWTIARAAGVSTLDPAAATDPASIAVCNVLYRGLVQLDSHLQIRPAAARSWKEFDHGLRYLFTLRPGTRFSNGTLLTADDVVGSLRRAVGPAGGNGVMAGYLSELALQNGTPAIFSPRHGQVEFILSRPSPEFLAKLTFVGASIVDMAAIHHYGPVWTSHVDGLGPFRVETTDKRQISLRRNHYFAPLPRLTQLTIRFASDRVATRRFTRGSTSVVSNLHPKELLRSRFGDAVRLNPYLTSDYLVLNTRRPTLNQVGVRRAMALTVRRKRLSRDVLNHSAQPSGSVVPGPLLPAVYDQVFNLHAALKALKDSGHPFARGLPRFRFVFPKVGKQAREASFLASTWFKKLGIRTTLRGLSPQAYAQSVRQGAFDIALVQWGAQYPDASDFLDQLITGSPTNFSRWSNAHFDHLMAISAREGIDSAVRRQVLSGANQIATSQAPWIALDDPLQAVLISPGVRGLSLGPQGLVGWSKAVVRSDRNQS